jgi:hypothetical protein
MTSDTVLLQPILLTTSQCLCPPFVSGRYECTRNSRTLGRGVFCAVHAVLNILYVVFFVISFYLQSVLVHSANCVLTYTVACRRVLSSAPLFQGPSQNTF